MIFWLNVKLIASKLSRPDAVGSRRGCQGSAAMPCMQIRNTAILGRIVGLHSILLLFEQIFKLLRIHLDNGVSFIALSIFDDVIYDNLLDLRLLRPIKLTAGNMVESLKKLLEFGYYRFLLLCTLGPCSSKQTHRRQDFGNCSTALGYSTFAE